MARSPRKIYCPILRSREAEMKGFAELSADVKDALLPIFEFTKSRRSKKNPNGAVSLCVDAVERALDSRPYIADVTTMDSLGSTEIDKLLNPERWFRNWRTFVATSLGETCIPTVHLTEPLDRRSISLQLDAFLRRNSRVAVRIPAGYEHLAELTNILTGELGGSLDAVILICDAGFVRPTQLDDVTKRCCETLHEADRYRNRIVAGSSFPSSVVLPGYGQDAYGKFDLLEVKLSDSIRKVAAFKGVVHGDYGLIHPEDFEGVVTNWVPRVDVPLNDQLFYHRYRRSDGGYQKAAEMAFGDPDYVALECWGHENIKSAARGNVQGRSPAHWIAVRVNFHISRQVARLSSGSASEVAM